MRSGATKKVQTLNLPSPPSPDPEPEMTLSSPEYVDLDPSILGWDGARIERYMIDNLIGQSTATEAIIEVFQQWKAKLGSNSAPIGSFLFLGPTGCGKTHAVETFAEAIDHLPSSIIKIDCAEYVHSHEIAKLIGSPPGYLGHRETHPLLSQEQLNVQKTDKYPFSIVLFDEIEKASDALWNLLLGVLDKGRLTLGDNRKVDFSSTIIFMTSNLGADKIAGILGDKFGFGLPKDKVVDSRSASSIQLAGSSAAKGRFNPEFINRLTKIITFSPLTEEEYKRILDLEVNKLQDRIKIGGNYGQITYSLSINREVREKLLSEGIDNQYGARFLKRTLDRVVIGSLSNLVASGQIGSGDMVEVYLRNGVVRFRKIREMKAGANE